MQFEKIGEAIDEFVATQDPVEVQPESQKKSKVKAKSNDEVRELKKRVKVKFSERFKPETKIKFYFIVSTMLLILGQIFFIKWWTLLTGPVTILLAIGIYKLFSDPTSVLEMIMDNLALSICIVIGVVAVVVQIVTLEWWTLLTGPVTILLAIGIYKLFSDPASVLEIIMDNPGLSLLIVIGVVAIVIQVVTLGWWSILTGVVTIVALALLSELLS